MPGLDGRGRSGEGPFTGGGRGFCAVVLPEGATGTPYGYAGAGGAPLAGARGARPMGPLQSGRGRRGRGRMGRRWR